MRAGLVFSLLAFAKTSACVRAPGYCDFEPGASSAREARRRASRVKRAFSRGWRATLMAGTVACFGCEADTVTPGGCSNRDARQCEDAKSSAQALLAGAAACSPGDSCKVISGPEISIPCSSLYCAVAVNSRIDEVAFRAQARVLQQQAGTCSACGLVCPMPLCVAPEHLGARCDPALRRCVLGQP